MSDLLKTVAHQSKVHNIQVLTLSNPAAGADFTITPRAGEDWRIIGLQAHMQTSAAVANRAGNLIVDDGTNLAQRIPPAALFTASQAWDVSWEYDLSTTGSSGSVGAMWMSLPPVVLPSGWRLRTLTTAIDVGDQWSGISFLIERMDEPPYLQPLVGTQFDNEVQAEISRQAQGGY